MEHDHDLFLFHQHIAMALHDAYLLHTFMRENDLAEYFNITISICYFSYNNFIMNFFLGFFLGYKILESLKAYN